MAKRKKTKRRAPQKKTQRAEEPDEDFETDEAEGNDGDEDAVDARFDDEDDEEVAAREPAPKTRGPGDRPVGPAIDPSSANARVSTSGGLWVMAIVFGLIAVAIAAQYLLG